MNKILKVLNEELAKLSKLTKEEENERLAEMVDDQRKMQENETPMELLKMEPEEELILFGGKITIERKSNVKASNP